MHFLPDSRQGNPLSFPDEHSKNAHFTGQPLYAQLFKLTDVQAIARLSPKGGHDRYTPKLDGYSHFAIMLFAVLMRYNDLREIVIGMEYSM